MISMYAAWISVMTNNQLVLLMKIFVWITSPPQENGISLFYSVLQSVKIVDFIMSVGLDAKGPLVVLCMKML